MEPRNGSRQWATEEARRRWGPLGDTETRGHTGDVCDPGCPAESRYRVGVSDGGAFTPKGAGASWEEAFTNSEKK